MPDNILNNATNPDGKEGDGVALQSTRHPIQTTDEMIAAGLKAYEATWKPGLGPRDMVQAVYTAMAEAEPVLPDISDAAIETVQVEYHLPDEQVEQFAIICALGNNGGEWAEHYTEEQKEHWRKFVRDLAGQVRQAHRLRMVDAGTEF